MPPSSSQPNDEPVRSNPITRRGIFAAGALAAVAATTATHAQEKKADQEKPQAQDKPASTDSGSADQVDATEGRLKQSVCKWCFPKLSLDELARHAAAMGMVGIDLLKPAQFETVKKHGLVCTMVESHKLANGLCDPKFHDQCIESISQALEDTGNQGWRNTICFSGHARGISRKSGMKHCVAALKKIIPVAEKAGVILNMELLNSKVDHPDYMCDTSRWGIELVKQVGSDHFKLLYDIYHMQIMEGDIIRTIEDNHQYFGHYHTAGNPGRHELDDTQELFYPAIAKAIADTGHEGFFAHEFRPTRDPVAGLREAVSQCIV